MPDDKKECKTITITYKAGNPKESITISCPFFEDIITMKADVKWLKKYSTVNIIATVSILLSIVSLVFLLASHVIG